MGEKDKSIKESVSQNNPFPFLSKERMRAIAPRAKYFDVPVHVGDYWLYTFINSNGDYIITAIDPGEIITDDDLMELIKYHYLDKFVVVEPYNEERLNMLKAMNRRYAIIRKGEVFFNTLQYDGTKTKVMKP